MVLRIVVLGSGAVLMALEIVGSRVLAPYFGSSVYVWGSLISIFLAALSLGYYLGGVAADRWPHPGALALTLGSAGLLTLLLPVAARPILEALAAWDLGPRASPLFASIVLFALPSVLMGATSPFAIKLAATTLATVGNTAGVLYAISTAGSIAGTLLTAFVLIPAMGVRAILYTLGVSLIVFSALMALMAARAARATRTATVVTVLALVLTLLGGPALAQDGLRVVFDRDTVYHSIRVYEDNTWRLLRFDRSLQGGMLLRNPLESPHRYPDYVHVGWLFNPNIRRVLIVGLGAGTMVKRMLHDYPQVSVDSVELDPVVVEVAKRFFEVSEGPRHSIIVDDGRRFIRRTDARYDLIILDAYNAEGIPFHLATREFVALAKEHLTPGGIIEAHIVGFLGGPNSRLFRAIYKTYATEFRGLYPFAVNVSVRRDDDEVRSIILVATDRTGVTSRDLVASLGTLRKERRASPVLQPAVINDYYTQPVSTADVPVITDDYPWRVDTLPVWNWEPARR